MPNDYSKYFFALNARSPVILKLKKYLNARPYLKAKSPLTDVFDGQMQASLAQYQKYHRLTKQDGTLNAETYMQIGREMSDIEIDMISLNQPELNKLFYGVDLVDITEEWNAVAPFIAKEKFIGWNHPGITKNCFDYCWRQVKNAGYDLKSPGWGTDARINPNIYQLYLTETVGNMKAGYQAQQFTAGVLYLKKAMQSKIPVMVGVEAHADVDKNGKVKHVNKDKVTDHYVTMVGMGSDAEGKYFSFFDNAVGDAEVGTSATNKFYCDSKNFVLKTLKGQVDARNTYVNGGNGFYIVTQIRESK